MDDKKAWECWLIAGMALLFGVLMALVRYALEALCVSVLVMCVFYFEYCTVEVL